MPVKDINFRTVVETILDRKTITRIESAMIYAVSGLLVDIHPYGSSNILHNVEVIGSADDLDVGQEVQLIWKDGRPYVLAENTAGSLAQYFPPDNVTIENSADGLRVKQGSLQESHLAFDPSLEGHRHVELEGALTAVEQGPGISVVGGDAVGIAGNQVMRYHASGELARSWPADADGIDQALETAMCGDLVTFPAMQLIVHAAGITIPDGVTLAGISKTRSIIKGPVHGGNNSVLENCSVWIKDEDAVILVGVYGPTTGQIFRVNDVIISVENKHNVSGDAYAVYAHNSDTGRIRLENCSLEAIALTGSAYAGWGYPMGTQPSILAVNCHIDGNTPWFLGPGVAVYNCLMEESTANLFCDYVEIWLYVVTQNRIARTKNATTPDPADVVWQNLTGIVDGTIVDFAIDPVNRSIAWASTTTGLFYTSNLHVTLPTWTCVKTPAQFQADCGHGYLVYPRGIGTTPDFSGEVWVFLIATTEPTSKTKKCWVGRSADGGITWFYSYWTDPDDGIKAETKGMVAVSPHDRNIVWAVYQDQYGRPKIKISDDAGFSWGLPLNPGCGIEMCFGITIPIEDNETSQVVCMENQRATPYITYNGGATWQDKGPADGAPPEFSRGIFDVGKSDRDYWISSTYPDAYVTDNGGLTWREISTVGVTNIEAVCLFENDYTILFAVGGNGALGRIWMSIDFGYTMVNIRGDWDVSIGPFTNPIMATTVAD